MNAAIFPVGLEAPLTPAAIGRAATLALHDELALAPKPGLVTPADNGSHDDMDAHTFMRSLFALRSYFVRIAEAGHAGVEFGELERCGIAAEARMLAATRGVNTHRGAIFMLGLLCAAAGAVVREGDGTLQPAQLRDALRTHWGAALTARSLRAPTLPGGIATRRLGLRGASEEAASGFPVLFEVAVPVLARGLAKGLSPQLARLDTLFHVMAVLDDSNLVHRGGLAGLRHAQAAARRFIDDGGAASVGAIARARAMADDFVARRLSPGGAADTLAAACCVTRICALP
ncbi:triphosphoribosyl-dephospho-CoA synthase [Variovorax sp. J22R24]|uniref:triphosphoribosyl-dephospho-CoA synthase n=1 Tax=Variovorax gracilis TaxID=3053502 RepID=UPI0025758771|nr:triphosphoribosyl-dephospho-CoA synthase [Variovorax sp. J22R24]MDM0107372.1 triphosphoribosyl-dephospho-CoA synthase [Variovorax sp. J22R24]